MPEDRLAGMRRLHGLSDPAAAPEPAEPAPKPNGHTLAMISFKNSGASPR
jgi:hypothetical protein